MARAVPAQLRRRSRRQLQPAAHAPPGALARVGGAAAAAAAAALLGDGATVHDWASAAWVALQEAPKAFGDGEVRVEGAESDVVKPSSQSSCLLFPGRVRHAEHRRRAARAHHSVAGAWPYGRPAPPQQPRVLLRPRPRKACRFVGVGAVIVVVAFASAAEEEERRTA